MGASSGWHGCLERKRTKILNESHPTEIKAGPRETGSDSACHSITVSGGKIAVIYFLASQIRLVIFENYFNQTNSKHTCSARKKSFSFFDEIHLICLMQAQVIGTAQKRLRSTMSRCVSVLLDFSIETSPSCEVTVTYTGFCHVSRLSHHLIYNI